ncbi:head GIN domain-containing protein [Spongiivirga sp. MCCC 1A20706]|uniref:head GIN domain-containing protein n=1 Tax=Spongiivirga sp. MCCC 1A20706 TaxID=3160963 RepID=UPI003977B7C2
MKKTTLFCAAFVLAITTANAQWWGNKKVRGNGNVKTETRNTSDYDQVRVAGFFDVELVSGDEGKLTVEAEENLLEYIITEVNGSSLKIYVEKGYNLRTTWNKGIRVTVPFEDLDMVTLSGSGDVVSKDVIKASNFTTGVSGSGDVNLKLDVNTLEGKVTGSGDLRLDGSTNDAEYFVTGSGDIYAFSVKAQDVSAKVTGSGDIRAHCDGYLTARITGSGDIRYTGNPKKEDSKVTGSGDIERAN